MRRLAALAALALALCACAASAPPSAPRCFTGPVPRVGRPARDELFALTRRERERAERAPPLVRARILEALPALFPSVGDLALAPRCGAELHDENAAALRGAPLVFSRLLVARLRTVHDVRLLLPLVARSEQSITPYQRGPDEPGAPPPRSLVRHLALAGIPAAWAVNNDPEARRLVLDRLRAGGDARALILVHGGAAALFREALRGDPARAQGGEGPSLLRAWLPDLARRLSGPADRASLELVLLRLADVGTYAAGLGAGPEARALVGDIVARRGELPIAQGIPGAARDLAEVARGALHDLEAPQASASEAALPPASEAALPPPRRDPFSVWRDWLDAEPAGGKVPAADALARVRDLDGELASLRFYAPRCRVIEELGQWLPPDEAPRRFDALVAPAFDGDHIRVSTETLCRLGVALRLSGVDEARRVKLLLRLLSAAPEQIGARDRSGDERGPAMGWPADEEPVGEVAARALARNLGWVERHADLRAWLAQAAAAPIPTGRAAAARWSMLQPAFERVVAWHTSGAPDARPEAAAAILRAWMESLRAGKAAAGATATHLPAVEVANARLRALGELGRRAGLAEEVGAFLAEREGSRSAVIAAYLLSL
ncbi:hypothetical protein [Sorangium sp. So ce131]|uniref:hypothetical protein n=1 Tax=Sorangium sp. So ce131 TaxID=3133282 RepID=UPI003F5FDA09